MAKPKITITVRLDPDVHKLLVKTAHEAESSLSKYVEEMIENYLLEVKNETE